jgi:4-alpha-glucanotransferase
MPRPRPSKPPAREAGVLLHPTSLPGRYGVGDFGDELLAFLDWAASAGMKLWQVLPLTPPGYGHSPYGCLSSFAGNPMLISPQRLLQASLLPDHATDDLPPFDGGHIDFDSVATLKRRLLDLSWQHFNDHAGDDQRQALAVFERENGWLDDWSLFAALKERHGGKPWTEWGSDLASRDPATLAIAAGELAEAIRFHRYVQWLFFTQWAEVRSAAAARNIKIMGDVPIYVAADSADVWANRELFQLDANGEPTVVAGVPPDYFSATGQRWGNPLYRWDVMRSTGYRWWISRVRASLRFADIVRLDHFRGFAAYWEIPAAEQTAVLGRWMPGPGKALFRAIREALGDLPLVAEDLGFITPEVHKLRRAIGVPGMKILQFAFAEANSSHLPHSYEPQTVVYTGTHDNDTARGWYTSAPEEERQRANLYLGLRGTTAIDAESVEWAFIRSAYTSVAQTAIVPVQDILGLGNDARMNLPGASANNWSWRLRPGALTPEHADGLRRLAEITGRV